MVTKKTNIGYLSKFSCSRGFSVLEIIISAAIIVTVLSAGVSSWIIYIKTITASSNQSQAALLIEEGSEILRLFRDHSWSNYIAPLSTVGTEYQLSWANNKFVISTNQNIIQNQYVRTFTLSAVIRDANDNIVSSGGATDPNTRKVSFSVFLVGATSTPIMQSEMLLHNVYGN